MTPRLLDLFCGGGGASMGYHRAGFEVVGVDINPQPRYPFEFVQGDATAPPIDLATFDAIHASPPCQHYSALKTMTNARQHPDLVDTMRVLLTATGKPWVIENVFGAPLSNPLMLCGSFFGLASNEFQLRRHRYFESSVPLMHGWGRCKHAPRTLGVYGAKVRDIALEKRHYSQDKATRGKPVGVVLPQAFGFEAMGIDWMKIDELAEAIPPAYTEYIGRQLIEALAIAQAA